MRAAARRPHHGATGGLLDGQYLQRLTRRERAGVLGVILLSLLTAIADKHVRLLGKQKAERLHLSPERVRGARPASRSKSR